jgi:hypothetical protein
MNRLAELRNLFLHQFGNAVAPLGFHRCKAGYERVVRLGSEFLIPTTIKHSSDFDITLDLAIRMNDVEEVLERGEGRTLDNLSTFGGDIGNIAQGKQRRWTVTDTSDVTTVVSAILGLIETEGFRFFREYSDRMFALSLFCKEGRMGMLLMPSSVQRAKLAVALAKIEGNSSSFEDVLKGQLTFLKSRGDPGFESFVEFAARLQQADEPRRRDI